MPIGVAIAATVALHLLRRVEVPLDDAIAVTATLAQEIEARTGMIVAIDELDWEAVCERTCVDAIRGRLGAEDVVFLTFVGGPSRYRVSAARHARTAVLEAARSFGHHGNEWVAPLRELAQELFPEGRPIDPGSERVKSSADPPSRVLPIGALALGVGALAGGLIAGATNASARDELEHGFHADRDAARLSSQVESSALVANVLFAGGIVALAGGLLWLLLDP
ncbi:MAG: hypothetical protein HYV07_33725 [Deltaproteobacteria bacterium]|nr:hypothetical protein [Deltaproteobacteria bacterium]